MPTIPYAIEVGPTEFIGTVDTDGPSTQGQILYSGLPVGDYNITGVDQEVILYTVDRTQKLGVHIHQNDIVGLWAVTDPITLSEIDNNGGWHLLVQW
jgi:hypothetical protein